MKQLTCEMCGSTDLMKQDGVFVCQSCGAKYKELAERKDNTSTVSNFLMIAESAHKTGNNKEAETYCNKIIEIEADNYEAWFLKGCSVGWQSAIGAFRFKEAAECFSNAVNCCVDEEKNKNLQSHVQSEFRDLANALIKLRCDRFKKWSDEEEAKGFISDLEEISNAITIYSYQSGSKINKNLVFSEVSFNVDMCMTVVDLNMLAEYKRANESRAAYTTLVEKTKHCVEIMKNTIELCDDDDESDCVLYNSMISMIKYLIKSNKTDLIANGWGTFKEVSRLSNRDLDKFNNWLSKFEAEKEKIIAKKEGN